MAFTWVIKLDKKNRLVVPMEARQRLGITDLILVKLESQRLVITKANGEKGRLISKNCQEIEIELDGLGGAGASTLDCGATTYSTAQKSSNPGANPGPSPINGGNQCDNPQWRESKN